MGTRHLFQTLTGPSFAVYSNVNDIETKLNKASILANNRYQSETNRAYSKTLTDRSRANPAYSRT